MKSADPSAPSLPVHSNILITGVPALIEFPGSVGQLFARADQRICVPLELRTLRVGSINVRATTLGLGRALLTTDSTLSPGLCDHGTHAALPVQRIRISDRATPLTIIIPEASFPHSGAMVDGRLLLLPDTGVREETVFHIQREPRGPIVTGSLWFFGILIPAAITGLIGLQVFSAQKRIEAVSTARAKLKDLRGEKRRDLAVFFSTHFPNVLRSMDDKDMTQEKLMQELDQAGITPALTERQRRQLITVIRKRDKKQLASRLRKLFPENAEDIGGALQVSKSDSNAV